MTFLENQYIKLRAPELSDLDLLYVWENDTSLWNTGCTLTPFSKQVLEKYLQTAHLDLYETHQLRLMIDLKEQNRTIGSIDLYEFEPYHNRAGVGILIASESDRNKGFGNYSLQLLIQYSFQILGLKQLYCSIDTSNIQSINLFQKNKFQIVGIKKRIVT